MQDSLEQELRRLITRFEADVRLAVLRSLQSAFAFAPDLGSDSTARAPDGLASVPVDPLPIPRAARRTLTPDELAEVRAKVTALIHQHPGQSTAELARIVGIPTGKLRPLLRQLIDERVIEVEEKVSGGLRRYRYRAAESRPDHRTEPLAMAAGASA
jgi:hypothetical protein